MFSDAINSISWRCRPSSPRIAAAISGSASVSGAVKNESGAEAALALLGEKLMDEYLHRRKLLRGLRAVLCGGRKSDRGISHCPAMAKGLRYPLDIYARYGGDGRDGQHPLRPRSAVSLPAPAAYA